MKEKLSKKEQNILKKMPEIFKLIEPGLQEGKCLIKDGLLNLTGDQLKDIDFNESIVLLTIYIQSYPKGEFEYKKDFELEDLCNAFKIMIASAVLCKFGFIDIEYGINKIYPDKQCLFSIKDGIIAIDKDQKTD